MNHSQFIGVLREAQVKSHIRTSKTGKKYTVQSFERQAADMASREFYPRATMRGETVRKYLMGKISKGELAERLPDEDEYTIQDMKAAYKQALRDLKGRAKRRAKG